VTRLIPNENTWVGFAAASVDPAAVVLANITSAIVLTPYLISLNASSRGNTVPTPSLDTLFETSISGTVQASFDADFYRDDETDLAWETLPRATAGTFLISRFGGTGVKNAPVATDSIEAWPVIVTSRTMANMSSNTVMSFTVSCSIPGEPNEVAIIAA
jgi:hypothetical protein